MRSHSGIRMRAENQVEDYIDKYFKIQYYDYSYGVDLITSTFTDLHSNIEVYELPPINLRTMWISERSVYLHDTQRRLGPLIVCAV